MNQSNKCFIIAEAGSNFKISKDNNLNFNQALKLIDVAKEAGADAVKFQLFRAKSLYTKDSGNADYLGGKKSIFEIISDMELPYEWLPKLKEYCDKKGIMFLCTPFDKESVTKLEEIGIKMYKIASYSVTNIPLLKEVAKKDKPILLSTGASTLEDIEIAVKSILDEGNNKITLLQCTAKYPAPLESINLRSINFIKKHFNLPVGLSDHSRDPVIAPLGAVALGATVIEKHFTTDNNLEGPDHKYALLPTELKKLVDSVRNLEKALGQETKKVFESEEELHDFCKNVIYARKNISKGELLTEDNLVVLRKGKYLDGLSSLFFYSLLGKNSKREIKEAEPLVKEDL